MEPNGTRRNSIEEHSPEVLSYAFKHNYPDILDEAAPLTIGKPKEFLSIASNTAPGLLLVWVRDFSSMITHNYADPLFFVR
jgi:hypothetical protein